MADMMDYLKNCASKNTRKLMRLRRKFSKKRNITTIYFLALQ